MMTKEELIEWLHEQFCRDNPLPAHLARDQVTSAIVGYLSAAKPPHDQPEITVEVDGGRLTIEVKVPYFG